MVVSHHSGVLVVVYLLVVVVYLLVYMLGGVFVVVVSELLVEVLAEAEVRVGKELEVMVTLFPLVVVVEEAGLRHVSQVRYFLLLPPGVFFSFEEVLLPSSHLLPFFSSSSPLLPFLLSLRREVHCTPTHPSC